MSDGETDHPVGDQQTKYAAECPCADEGNVHESHLIHTPHHIDGECRRSQCEGCGPDGLVFGNGRTHMKRESDREFWFATALTRARKTDPTIPRVTLHDLRHTAASLAISSGANVKAVQRMLGHASAAVTSRCVVENLDTVRYQFL